MTSLRRLACAGVELTSDSRPVLIDPLQDSAPPAGFPGGPDLGLITVFAPLLRRASVTPYAGPCALRGMAGGSLLWASARKPHAGLAEEALTKLNWNNTQFDGREPATLCKPTASGAPCGTSRPMSHRLRGGHQPLTHSGTDQHSDAPGPFGTGCFRARSPTPETIGRTSATTAAAMTRAALRGSPR
jgi:hypothetical protein